MPLILNGDTGISGVDGSAGTPSYQGNDSNTGVFFPAADTIAFAEGGVEVARFDSSGNLGIGTSSPTSRLVVQQANNTGDALRVFANGSDTQLITRYLSSSDLWQISASFASTGAYKPIAFFTSDAERMRIASNGDVGIGTSTPGTSSSQGKLSIISNGVGVGVTTATENGAGYHFATYNSNLVTPALQYFVANDLGDVNLGNARGAVKFYANNTTTERMRITSAGELLVGKTASNYATAGCQLNNNGEILATRNGVCLSINRLSTDGDSLQFYQASSLAGAIGTNGGSPTRLFIVSGDTGIDFESSTDAIRPCSGSGGGRDNAIDLGRSDVRFKTAYITNGVVTGSDLNDKQDIEELTDAETRVAIACKGLLRKWRWKDSVVKKGDDARIHFGIIAQDLKAAFEAEGLDAGRYSMFVWNEWWESTEIYKDSNGIEKTRINTYQKQEDAPEGAVRKERMGIRYNELLAFMIAAI